MTRKLSFMLSGAQFGIMVTALLVGYVAEPLLGRGLGVPFSMVIALVFATFVQMVLGELLPKNLAIARPERLALALSSSTLVYLKIAGPVIRLFDAAANRLLRAIGIEPVEELPQGATPEDLKQIVEDAGERGHPDPELTRLLEHGIGFRDLVAEQAMTPRVNVHTVRFDEPAARVVSLLDTGNSRFPVVGEDLDDLRGVVGLAEVLTLTPAEREDTPIEKIASPALVVPATLPLPAFFPPAQFAGRVQQVELTFVASPHELYVVLEADRRGGMFSSGGDAFGHFRLSHQEAQVADWASSINGWLAQVAARGGAMPGYDQHGGHHGRGIGMGTSSRPVPRASWAAW